MADEHYKWLSPDAAERLLCGEALGSVDDHAREQAERLAKTLSALTPADLGTCAELPGEEAALAAFRSARSAPLVAAAAVAHEAHGGSVRPAHIGTPQGFGSGSPHQVVVEHVADGAAGAVRWGRSLRWGMAAAVAACMIGGVAAAGGAGVLPSPFKNPHPSPASSVTAGPDVEEPLSSDFPDAPESEDGLTPRPGDPRGEPGKRDDDHSSSGDAEARGKESRLPTVPGGDWGHEPADRPDPDAKEWWRRAVETCRQYEAGTLDADKLHALEEAAKGAGRLERYCDKVLEADGDGQRDPDGEGGGGEDSDHGHSGGGGRPADGGGDNEDGAGESPSPTPSKVSTLPASPPSTTLPTASYSPTPEPTGSGPAGG